MRARVTIDDELLARARELSGLTDASEVVTAGLQVLVQREVARRLIAAGGTAPDFEAGRRRRFT